MNQTLVRRVGMALGIWTLLRRKTRLCRWSSIGENDGGAQGADVSTAPRWLGQVRIGRHTHHALFCPPSRSIVYRFLAPPRSRIVAWCGVHPVDRHSAGAEFSISVRIDGSTRQAMECLRLDPERTAADRTWRKLVLELHNENPWQIEVTFRVTATGAGSNPQTLWGEPKLEWPRPFSETSILFRAAVGQVIRGRPLAAARTLHGRLSERSNPTLYDMWLSQRTPSAKDLARMRTRSETFAHRPLLSVVTPVYNTDARWLRACIESVKAQVYDRWQLCLADDGSVKPETREVLREYQGDPRIRIHTLPRNSGIAVASNAALALAEGEFVAFLDHDDEISPDALFEVAAHLNEHPDTDFIYSDEDKLELDGTRTGVYFKPGWSPEHFLTNMYTCHLMVVRRSLLERIGGFRAGFEGAQDYDLVLRLIEHTTRIHHLPKVLYHWRRIPESTAGSETAKPWAHDAGKLALEDYVHRNNLNAEILPGEYRYLYRVRFAIRDQPLVSILLPAIPLAAGLEARQSCERTIRTLAERTTYRCFEVLQPVESNGAHVASWKSPLNLPIREVPTDGTWPDTRLGQQAAAAAHARGDHLVFLDWGLQGVGGDWLTALLEFSQQPGIGAVGGKLHYPDGSLAHIGILLGVNGVASPAFHRHPRSTMGYWAAAIAARNYSAVTGACMMTRRRVFEEVGGFRGEMGRLADIDYCLRVTDAGYRVVFTPHAALVHDEMFESSAHGAGRDDEDRFRLAWGDRLASDPYYNANLSREAPDYEPSLSVSRERHHFRKPTNVTQSTADSPTTRTGR
jgi:GT2 family glycosyltransferase